jgi:hypothetical protein
VKKRYASFFIRWWRIDSGQQRVEIEHIQTGERTLLDSLRAAFKWIGTRERDTVSDRDSAPGQMDSTLDGDTEPLR